MSDTLRDLVTLPDQASPAPHPSVARRYRRISALIALSDATCVVLAIVVARLVRYGFRYPGPRFPQLLILGPLVTIGVFLLFGLYSLPRLSPAEEFRRLIEAASVAALVKLFTDLLLDQAPLDALSRGWLVVAWIVTAVLVLVTREAWHKHLGRMRSAGTLLYRTLILGANAEAAGIGRTLSSAFHGYLPIGLIQVGHESVADDDLEVLGTVDDLPQLIAEHGIECLFVASTAVDQATMKRVAKALRRTSVEVRVSANIQQMLASRVTIQPIGPMLALSLKPVRLSGGQAAAKRVFDLLVGSVAALLLLPPCLAIALAIKASSRGPVLYLQERVGHNGRTFRMFKFRTMVREAEKMLPTLLTRNEFQGGVLFKLRDDPRVTRVGGWLRRWSLDELPQILNVLKGDMSMVGPRPALASEVATYEEWHRDRLEVPPGITGLWQVSGRSELSFDDYVRLDLFYIENWSVMYDLFIIAKTVPAVVLRRGAY